MSIYTKKGDKGRTGLPGDRRLSKTDQLFETLGYFDQSNALIGLAISGMGKKDRKLCEQLRHIQSNFLALGACLASINPKEAVILGRLEQETAELESQIDRWDEILPPLRNFILAGGTKVASVLHVVRAEIRMAERQFHRLPIEQKLPAIGQYLNRLSDYFFQASRFVNHQVGQKDIVWRD